MDLGSLSAWRLGLGVGGFGVLWLIEVIRPFRRDRATRWSRVVTNLTITGSNALILSVCLGGALVALYQQVEFRRLGVLQGLGITSWANIGLTLIFLDGVTYGWHRAYHGLPLLWRMHRVHHSDQALDVTTSGRFHLAEMGLSALFRLGVITMWGPSVAAVIIFEIVFGAFNQLEHANLQIPQPWDRWLRAVVVTPSMHRVHHSQVAAHTNSNYATIFSWWDRLFGTYRVEPQQEALVIGLPEYPRATDVTLGKVLAMPFDSRVTTPAARAATLLR